MKSVNLEQTARLSRLWRHGNDSCCSSLVVETPHLSGSTFSPAPVHGALLCEDLTLNMGVKVFKAQNVFKDVRSCGNVFKSGVD